MKINRISVSLGLLLLFASAAWVTSCRHEANIADFPEVCFERDVLPVFLNSCAITGCHSGNGEAMRLTNYAEISDGVVPGKPYSSKVYTAVISTFGEGKMPPNQPLSLDNRTIIRIWIEQGAANTTCAAAAVSQTKKN
jgi:hypothetical protein